MAITRTGIFTDTGGTRYLDVAGVLRNPGTGWEVFGDAQHQSMNIIGHVTSDAQYLYVNFPTVNVAKIVYMTVVPDESLAVEGIFAGASVIIGQARIYIAQNCTGVVTQLNPSDNAGPCVGQFKNLWLSGRFQLK